MTKLKHFILVAVFCFTTLPALLLHAQDEDLLVLKDWHQFSDTENALYHYLADESFHLLEKRVQEVSRLSGLADWQQRQILVKMKLAEIIGPFPERTPLNVKITGILKKDGYTVEKLYYESQPEFYVTACLFLPDNSPAKAPAIIYCSGHSNDGFRNPAYQQVILNLVKKGFIVFAFDPVSQGERWQYFDPDTGSSIIGGPTEEHSYSGAQCFLTGASQAQYMIWDGIRAVDYLLTRPEVDPDRIGITGRSGGGTQSAYIAAMDERILAAAPECYITGFKRLLESIGLQDSEQNFYHGLAAGMDHADLLEVRAPKPALMITTTRDYFSIQGARETADEIKKVYQAYGKPANFAMIEDDNVHASTQANRERMYAFFQKSLRLPGNSRDEEVTYLGAEELQVTGTGQVITSLGGATIHSLNARHAAEKIKETDHRREKTEHVPAEQLTKIAALTGFRPPQDTPEGIFTGRYIRKTYSIEKYFIYGEGNYPLPFLLFRPQGDGPFQLVIYLHNNDKKEAAQPGGEIEWFVNQGCIVIAPDIIGKGEIGPERFSGDSYEFKPGHAPFNIWFMAIQNGRSLVSVQAADLLRIVRYAGTRTDVDSARIYALARGEVCPVLTHAAAFDQSIKKIVLIDPLVSSRALVMNKFYAPKYMITTVAGSIDQYDLQDLYAAIAPRPLLLVNVVDHMGQLMNKDDLDQTFSFVKKTFAAASAGQKFTLFQLKEFQPFDDLFVRWINED